MRAVLPFDAAQIDEPQIGLVRQGSGLESVTPTLTGHVTVGQAPQL